MKNITREFFFHVDKPKIYHAKFYEIPRLGRCPTYEEFTLTTFQGTIDKVTYLYRNRNSDLHPKLYSTIKFEIHWLENKLHALYGQEEDGEEEQHDNGLARGRESHQVYGARWLCHQGGKGVTLKSTCP